MRFPGFSALIWAIVFEGKLDDTALAWYKRCHPDVKDDQNSYSGYEGISFDTAGAGVLLPPVERCWDRWHYSRAGGCFRAGFILI